jgi:hypothetical protein
VKLSFNVVSKGVWIQVFIVCFVVLLADALPDGWGNLWEESVGILPCMMYMGDI